MDRLNVLVDAFSDIFGENGFKFDLMNETQESVEIVFSKDLRFSDIDFMSDLRDAIDSALSEIEGSGDWTEQSLDNFCRDYDTRECYALVAEDVNGRLEVYLDHYYRYAEESYDETGCGPVFMDYDLIDDPLLKRRLLTSFSSLLD